MTNCLNCHAPLDPASTRCASCGEPITPFMRLAMQGPIDGKYELLSRLGAGGMGEVYKVRHVHLHTVRVIKVMKPGVAGEGNELHERFAREARLATRISHPNVATLHDFSSLSDGSFYMVWEYIEGVNLADVLAREKRLSLRRAARISIQALRGIDAINQAGIVHRDISPDNIILTHDARGAESVKLIDLGIAKQSEGGSDQTQAGFFVGKWRYCSPEHLGMLPQDARIDGRADIYSYGIVLYELVAGAPPFTGNSPGDYYRQHAREAPKPLRVLDPSLPEAPELEALIFKALQKDREQRFQTAGEFADALQELLSSLPDEAAGVSTLPSATMPTGTVPASAAPTERTPLPQPMRHDATVVVPPSDRTVVVPQRQNDATVVAQTPSRTVVAATPAPVKKSPIILIAVLLGLFLLAAVAGGAFLLLNRTKGPQAQQAQVTPPVSTVATASAAQPAVTQTVPSTETITVTDVPVTQSATATETTAPTTSFPLNPAAHPDTPQKPRPTATATQPAQSVASDDDEPSVDTQEQPTATQGGRRGGFFERMRGRRGGRTFAESEEYGGRHFLQNVERLTRGDEINWSWKSPNVQLAAHKFSVAKVGALDAAAPAGVLRQLESSLQSNINDATEDASGDALTLHANVVSAANTGTRAGGLTVEFSVKQGSAVVASGRHTSHGKNLEAVAGDVAEAIAAFIEEN